MSLTNPSLGPQREHLPLGQAKAPMVYIGLLAVYIALFGLAVVVLGLSWSAVLVRAASSTATWTCLLSPYCAFG